MKKNNESAYVKLARETIENYVKQGKNVIVLRTFSKAYGLAGLQFHRTQYCGNNGE